MMTIKQWPKPERPRERLLRIGAHTLSDAELVATVIGKGIKGLSAIDLARQWLQFYGGLHGLFTADFNCLSQQKGIGQATYCQLSAIVELQRRYLQEALQRHGRLVNPQDAKQYIAAELRHHTREVFACLFLDNHHRIIQFERLFYGSVSHASIYPREVVKRALYHNAAALIVAHNHPSGVAQPSRADRDMTRQLRDALTLVDVRLLDHLVVGEQSPFSFAEQGWL